MPEEPAADCPPDAENNTPDAPAPRPVPLQHSDKADIGCLIFLGVMLVGVFLFPVAVWFGGPFVIVVITGLLLVLATPILNPMEKYPGAAKWWGRAITLLVLVALLVAAYFWITRGGETAVEEKNY